MGADSTAGAMVSRSPCFTARLAGVFYLLNILTALPAYFGGREHPALAFAFGHFATVCYVAVTILFYYLFRPVSGSLSLVAALFSLAGSALGTLSLYGVTPFHINTLVFFGFYCVLLGYLILRSTFLPRILGGLIVIAGFGWLTFVSRPLAAAVAPVNYWAGGIAEGSLTLWLLFVGVNAGRWKQQAGLGLGNLPKAR